MNAVPARACLLLNPLQLRGCPHLEQHKVWHSGDAILLRHIIYLLCLNLHTGTLVI